MLFTRPHAWTAVSCFRHIRCGIICLVPFCGHRKPQRMNARASNGCPQPNPPRNFAVEASLGLGITPALVAIDRLDKWLRVKSTRSTN
eukprot:s1601_g2.t1